MQKEMQSVIDAAKSSRRASVDRSASMAQLRLSNMKLHGREDDMKYLRKKLLELKKNKGVGKNSSNLPQLILISGISGSGKSALVMKGVRDPAERMGMVFVGGKFDLNNTALPMSAFVDAMAALVKQVMKGGDKAEEILQSALQTFNGEELLILATAFPGCEDLFDSAAVRDMSQRQSVEKRQATAGGKEAVGRMQYLIRGLLKVICSSLDGVCLFVDDLQWSDSATLNLLKSISLDSEIPSLLLVGAYRADEVDSSHPLALQIEEKKQMGIEISEISIGNLCQQYVQSLIAESLGMDDNEGAVETLADIIHKKTGKFCAKTDLCT